jgi:hypothetical protein
MHMQPMSPPGTPNSVEPLLPFDATVLFKALQYQLLVAIEQCHGLKPDECLWIEAMGDVTVPGKTQIEVKHYSDSLTDSHQNFWNTIKNWLHGRFDRSTYKTLVLLTTQQFGAQSRLKEWNCLNPEQRLKVMKAIALEAQAKPKAQDSSDQASGFKPLKVRALQHHVLAPERHAALMEVLERMHIITGEDALPERIDNYKTHYLKPIRLSLQQQYLDDLLGFMFSTGRVLNGWMITHGEFTAKLSALTLIYMKHPQEFPLVDTGALEGEIDLDEVSSMPFAQKILEIDGDKYLKHAALHRLVAQKTISDLYKDQILFKPVLDLYLHNHRSSHLLEREAAMLNCDNIEDRAALQKESRKFYLARLTVLPAPFCGMNNTMLEFRNGIYHMLADESPKSKDEEFHWKLWE